MDDFAERSLNAVESVVPFGNLFPERVSGMQIIENMKTGRGKDGFSSIAAKIIVRKELVKLQ